MAVPYAGLILEQKINTFPCHISQIILGDKLWEISKCLLLINAIRSATGAIPSALGKGVLGGAPRALGRGPCPVLLSVFICWYQLVVQDQVSYHTSSGGFMGKGGQDKDFYIFLL